MLWLSDCDCIFVYSSSQPVDWFMRKVGNFNLDEERFRRSEIKFPMQLKYTGNNCSGSKGDGVVEMEELAQFARELLQTANGVTTLTVVKLKLMPSLRFQLVN